MNIEYIEKNTDSKIEYYKEIDSTSNRAKDIAEQVIENLEDIKNIGFAENKNRILNQNEILNQNKILNQNEMLNQNKINLVISEKQTNGKGTKGRVWQSNEAENILMTMIFYPQNSIEELNGITYKIAEMIQSAIQELYEIKLDIKLPNDLLLNGKKICGILTESSIQNQKVKYLLIGVGFDVNQVEFPEELSEIATSLKREYPNREFGREEIVVKIFNNVKSMIS